MKETVYQRDVYKTGRLTARPTSKKPTAELLLGLQRLQLNQPKECLLYVPRTYNTGHPAAFALLLHGAGGAAAHGLSLLQPYADERNIVLLAPASLAYSWDIIAANGFSNDVLFIDRALDYVFERFVLRADKMAIGGFSDGASYALCLGLGNGDLFTHVLAFSPGFYYTYQNKGKPTVFVSHGTDDDVLPIGPCSRRIVPRLRSEGLPVLYEEFNGRHELPPPVLQQAVDWYLA